MVCTDAPTTSVTTNIPPSDTIDICAGGIEDVPSFGDDNFKSWRKKFKSYGHVKWYGNRYEEI